MNDLELMHCIERTRRSERRPDMLHILDEMAKRLQVKANVTPITSTSQMPGISLYRHFDKEDRLLYVGVSLDTARRLRQHRERSHWFNRIARIEIEKHPTHKEALAAETAAIQQENPECNVHRNGISEIELDDLAPDICPVCEAARKRNIARQKRFREKHDAAAVLRD